MIFDAVIAMPPFSVLIKLPTYWLPLHSRRGNMESFANFVCQSPCSHSVITVHLPDELREFVNNALWRQIVITHLHFSSTTIFLLHPGCAANAVMPRAGLAQSSHF